MDLAGTKFGKWTVLERSVYFSRGRKRSSVICRCECGKTNNIILNCLLSGGTTQCRTCSNKMKASLKSRLTHGQTHTRLYSVYFNMRSRCRNPSHQDFKNYGGRGILLCDEWNNFEGFYRWAMQSGYQIGLTIDRKNNNGNYCPDNCHWIPRPLQTRNQRTNVYYEWRGKKMILPEWADLLGISCGILRQRICVYKWSIERAFTTAPRFSPKRKVA